jgi:copper transport protein
MIGRRLRTTVLLMLVLVPAMLFGLSGPASAHANLVRTDPAAGAVLPAAPDRILFTFDETVRGVPHGVQVFDARGAVVEARATVQGAELTVSLAEKLSNGTTVITWRVVSDDGHPIGGALTFSVGAPSQVVVPAPSEASGVPDVPATLTAIRWVGYVGLLLAAGLVAFTALFLRACPATGVRNTTRAAAAVAVAAWLAVLPVSAVYLLGGGPSLLGGGPSLLGGGLNLLGRGSAWSSLPPTDYAVSATVVLGLVAAVILLGAGSVSPGRRLAATAAAALAVTAPAMVGHTRAAAPEALVVAADALHLLAGGVWLGGVTGLALTLPALSRRGTAAAGVLSRFSTAAAGILAALVATGGLLTWRILGSWPALTGTTYGRLLLAKVALVLIAVAVAAWNRWKLLPGTGRASAKTLTRAVTVEAGVLVAALLLTGFLVDTSPERDTAPVSAPDRTTTTLGDITVTAGVDPLIRGANTLTLRLTSASGEPTEGVAPPVVRLSSDRAALGAVPLTQVSAGFYTAPVTLPTAGVWRVQVSLRVSEFANPVGELEFTVSG